MPPECRMPFFMRRTYQKRGQVRYVPDCHGKAVALFVDGDGNYFAACERHTEWARGMTELTLVNSQ